MLNVMAGATRSEKMLIGGTWLSRGQMIALRNPYDGEVFAEVPRGTVEDVDASVQAASRSLEADFPLHARHDVLMKAAALIDGRRDEYARTIAMEGSKTIREARREPVRTANILRLAAEEGRRLTGETLPFDSRAGSENRVGYYFRFPVGVVAAIIPFNDPLALAAHNIAPRDSGGKCHRRQAECPNTTLYPHVGARPAGGWASRRSPKRSYRTWR